MGHAIAPAPLMEGCQQGKWPLWTGLTLWLSL